MLPLMRHFGWRGPAGDRAAEPGARAGSVDRGHRKRAAPGGLRARVPVAFVAVNNHDEVLGGVGLQQDDLVERRDRSPWVVGTIVRPDRRSSGVGQAFMERLSAWAAEAGITQLWVATGGRAIRFYQRCGFEVVETVPTQDGGEATILTKRLLTTAQ